MFWVIVAWGGGAFMCKSVSLEQTVQEMIVPLGPVVLLEEALQDDVSVFL